MSEVPEYSYLYFQRDRLEIIEFSGISESFKQFLTKYLVPRMGHPYDDDKEFLFHLQNAQTEPTLSDQVFHLLDAIKPHILEDNLSAYDDCIDGLAKVEWTDSALEFFEYLLSKRNYPIENWLAFFSEYGKAWTREDFNKLYNGEKLEKKSPSKRPVQLIVEGLLRHIGSVQSITSPLSPIFWFQNRICAQLTTSEDRSNRRASLTSFLSEIAEVVCTEMLVQGQLAEAKNFLLWIIRNEKDRFVSNWCELHEAIANVPVPAPYFSSDVEESTAVPVYLNAIHHDCWEMPDGSIKQLSWEDKEPIISKLESIATKCSQDKIRLPHKQMVELLWMPNWEGWQHIFYSPGSYQEALSLKLFSLLRSRLKNDPASVDISDYKQALNILIQAKEHNKLLRQLLITLRQASEPCSDESLEFKPKPSYKPQPLAEINPYYSISCLLHLLLTIRDQNRSICIGLADYCLSRVKFKQDMNKQFDSKDEFYSCDYCVEPNPIWRNAYVKALGELGYDLKGNVHKTLDFIKKHDPSEEVRVSAKSSYKSIHREKNKNLEDFKSFMAAFFWLRWAQREALAAPVNSGAAMLTRRAELRLTPEHLPDLLYQGLCWHL
jgi:hypothetical protein